MTKINYIAIALIVVTVLLEGINIFLSNRVSTDSIWATKLRQEVEILEEKNQNLRSEILEYTSFEHVASRAAELGFIENRETISLGSPVEVAASR